WSKEGGRYVPYLVNWLRDCRWNDEFSRPAQEGTAQTQGGVYEIAESGWCYLNKSESRREDAQPGSAKATPEEKDSEFEAVWAACPFEPGPKVISYGYWKGIKKQYPEMDTGFLLAAVSAASPEYERKLWHFLKEHVDIAD
ncbi:MAG: hypothetical protein IJD04_06425, partial [Desulfovibrionaceae bacterium]|nr:hypothetical protein [Desulfovibrionaceae bacterium]